MAVIKAAMRNTKETLDIYWALVRIMAPIAVVAEILSRTGVIKAVTPVFDPVMGFIGLPPELGLAWLTAMLIGIWGAVPLIFALVPASTLSAADVTIFSALILYAHGLPIEQKIIQKAGPGMVATTLLRIVGGLIYAFLLHRLFAATGWLSSPVNPAWIPVSATPDWITFFLGLAETMITMLIILVVLSWGLEILRLTGLLDLMMRALSPVLRLAGIQGEAGHFTAVGLFLGISYGGGLLIREARRGAISPRQIFLSCIFMGFAHSVIEDTLLVVALGADLAAVLLGRLVFAVAATATIAVLLRTVSDNSFYIWAFRRPSVNTSRGVHSTAQVTTSL
ncbi:nucleoside recognition domain-containing protein [Mesorhizobium tamadayense]|uniref:nucleoside recognition domain-containing protein n=1 Tax=Mesorhizobium tamadayense TaxID=425306 RepID=UPI00142DAF52|nr:nucleoside recognition domain-containing protein [Mesorhizobium tamadayense]